MSANVATSTLLGVRSEVEAEHDFLPFRRPLDARAPSLSEAAGLTPQPGSVSRAVRAAQRLPTKPLLSELGPLQLEAERQVLKQQALATTRVTWNTRSTQYTTVLAVLAAALFLVGFGLVVEGSIRGVTYALGLAIASFVVVWGAWIYHLPIPSTPENAITAAAQGAVLTSDGDYRGAVAAYDRAIAAHEDFATAYTGRARASLLAANPDYPLTRAFTDSAGSRTAAAVTDARRALDLGGHRDLLGDALVGLVAFYRGDYEQAVSSTDAAIAINPDVPDVWLLKSAAQLALGDEAGAESSLTRALGLLNGTDPSQRTRLLAASYLSYLASVAHNKPARAPHAQRLADRVVATETAFTLGRKLPRAALKTGRIQVDSLRFANGRLGLVIRWRGLPQGTALGAVAYEVRLRTAPGHNHPISPSSPPSTVLECGGSPCRCRGHANQPRSGPTSISTERRLSPPSAPELTRHVEHAPLKSALHHADPGICGFLRIRDKCAPTVALRIASIRAPESRVTRHSLRVDLERHGRRAVPHLADEVGRTRPASCNDANVLLSEWFVH